MTLAPIPTLYTPDDLLNLEDEGLFELVDGKLVEKQMSSLANETAGLITTELNLFIRKSSAGGIVLPEQTFQCFPHAPDRVRRPDVAFVLADRRQFVPRTGHVPIPPDIAIEVISPNDKMYEFEEKLADYRSAEIKLVWEVNPKFRFIRVHRLDGVPTRLGEEDTLTGEMVLPSFSIVVKDFLPPREKR